MVMDNLTSLPERWSIKITNNNKRIISDYFHSIGNKYIGYNKNWSIIVDYFLYFPQPFTNMWASTDRKSGYTEITFEQFEEFILNKSKKTEWLWNL